MREIKFRGLRAEYRPEYGHDKWKYGNLLNAQSIGEVGADLNSYEYATVIPETVGQYTGLKDKNGKEIYEGDLCHTNNETYGIELQEAGGAYKAVNINSEENPDDIHFLISCNHFLEVIGNIHSNPELL